MTITTELREKALNTIRFLSADAIQQANSGHPGLPMGTASIGYTLFTKHMRHNPADPKWINRDRFILSGGHGSMLLYSLLHLTGYDLSLDDLKKFRQLNSLTPGHPEYGLTPGVEVTTGPLGQGFCNGVGMAIAQENLAARLNTDDFKLIDHFIYAIVTDGDLMEGITAEAASLAGHLKLRKLIYLYDDNRISIDGSTDLAFTEDRGKRFEAYGWHVSYVDDGNNLEAIDNAILAAQKDPRPSIIICRTTIGYRLATRAGTSKAHGEPPGDEELNKSKELIGWPVNPRFNVDEDVRNLFNETKTKGAALEAEWQKSYEAYKKANPDLAAEFERILSGKLPEDWDAGVKPFPADEKGMATRISSGKAINMIASNLPDLVGGSADLHPSTKTWIDGSAAFTLDTPMGRNVHYGVREHGMGAIVNGMSTYPGIIPFGATFFVFSDYMRGAIRVSAVSEYPAIWVFTHDSIGVGEDGPTHQPIEHLASFRAMPNMVVLRPGDANEVVEAWRTAILHQHGPTMLILSRQNVSTLDREKFAPASGIEKGAYVLADLGNSTPEIILMASGTELGLIVKAGEELAAMGKNVRLISFPSWELFKQQDKSYHDSVLLPDVKKRVSVEAGASLGWERWVGDEGCIIAIDTFGKSAPYDQLMPEFGFSVENVVKQALAL